MKRAQIFLMPLTITKEPIGLANGSLLKSSAVHAIFQKVASPAKTLAFLVAGLWLDRKDLPGFGRPLGSCAAWSESMEKLLVCLILSFVPGLTPLLVSPLRLGYSHGHD